MANEKNTRSDDLEMISLGLGMIAALAWGIHDVCVRYVSQRTGIVAALLMVLVLGSFLAVPVAIIFSEGQMTRVDVVFAVTAGLTFAFAGYALYQALSIGPVRLVAPIIGSYPILSVGWAAMNGATIDAFQWIAVLLVIGGVGFVAGSSDASDDNSRRRIAVLWSLLACVGFAVSFALAHIATTQGTEFSVNAVSRLTALVCVAGYGIASGAVMLPARSQIPLLTVMGSLDCLALGAVVYAGTQANPEYSAVAASSFGMITVILAALFLREKMTWAQWAGVAVVFSAIAYLAL
jgi:drug/metabolite transporter (DMT)-like permease